MTEKISGVGHRKWMELVMNYYNVFHFSQSRTTVLFIFPPAVTTIVPTKLVKHKYKHNFHVISSKLSYT